MCLVACVGDANEPCPRYVNFGEEPVVIPLVGRQNSKFQLVLLKNLVYLDVVALPLATMGPCPPDSSLGKRERAG